jgi:hypothetical protein
LPDKKGGYTLPFRLFGTLKKFGIKLLIKNERNLRWASLAALRQTKHFSSGGASFSSLLRSPEKLLIENERNP